MIHSNNDLLNKLNNTSAEGAAKAEPSNETDSAGKSEKVTNASDSAKAAADQAGAEKGSTEPKSASKKEEPSGSEETSWSVDSAMKEIKKLREENKTQRVKYSEKLEELQKENQERFESLKGQVNQYEEYKKQLEELKNKEEDKKRSLEEKLSHREAKLAEIETLMKVKEHELGSKLEEYKIKVAAYEADRAAEQETYKNRVDEILGEVPEKFKEHAQLIVKGAGDPRDALIALNEAKLKGLFEERKVVVNHSIPGASDGARTTKEQMENAAKQMRSKMNSSQLIGEALKQIRSGEANTAFKKR